MAQNKFEIIETINPQADAMVRTFHCAICDKQHLQTGEIARVWVSAAGGYSANASMECFNALTEGDKAEESITIKGQKYTVVIAETPESYEAKGLNNLAANMRTHGITRALYIRKPNGQRLHHVNQFGDRGFSKITAMPML